MRDYEVETWAPDFDDVKLDTMIVFERARSTSLWTYQFGVDDVMEDLVPGDLMRVIKMRGRPREAEIEVLRTAKMFRTRVDQLLEWHDTELVTIIPG
jgi:hypothetical protein